MSAVAAQGSALPEIVKRQMGDDEVSAVTSEDVHSFLGVKGQLSTWSKRQVESLGGAQGMDWEYYSPVNSNGRGQPQKLYIFSVDFAKHVGMASKTPKGRQLRQYFIDAEKAPGFPLTDDDIVGKALMIVNERLAIAEGTVVEQAETIEAMAPAYDLSEARTQGKLSESTSSAWKASMGRRKLTRAIRDLMKANLWNETGRGWRWRQSFIDDGWGHDRENTYGGGGVKDECAWYEKGRLALPLWMAEQDRQGRTHGDVAPLPARIPDDPQGRLPEGTTV